MGFMVDSRIQESSVLLSDWELSRVFLKNDAHFPWVILVPREEAVQDIYQLSKEKQSRLMDEISAMSRIMDEVFNPDKLNIASLGNIVSQLHIHIVARYKVDSMWPHGVWQPDGAAVSYSPERLGTIRHTLTKKIVQAF